MNNKFGDWEIDKEYCKIKKWNEEDEYVGEYSMFGLKSYSIEAFIKKMNFLTNEYYVLRMEIQEEDEYEKKLERDLGVLDDSCLENDVFRNSSANMIKLSTFKTLRSIGNDKNVFTIKNSDFNKIINEEILEEISKKSEEEEEIIKPEDNQENIEESSYKIPPLVKSKSEYGFRLNSLEKFNLSEPSKTSVKLYEEDFDIKKKYEKFEEIVGKGWKKGKLNF